MGSVVASRVGRGAIDDVGGVRMIGDGTRTLIDEVIRARDPMGRFKNVREVRFPLRLEGAFFETQGNEAPFARGFEVVVNLRDLVVTFIDFPEKGLRAEYRKGFAQIHRGRATEAVVDPLRRLRKRGDSLAALMDVASQFAGDLRGPASLLAAPFLFANELAGRPFGKRERIPLIEQFAFMGYALINYVLFPNNLTNSEMVESVERVGTNALRVTYRRDQFPTNSRVQLYEFDPKTKLLAMHRYGVEYIHPSIGAQHQCDRHRIATTADGASTGIHFVDRRIVHIGPRGTRHDGEAQIPQGAPLAIRGDFGDFVVTEEARMQGPR